MAQVSWRADDLLVERVRVAARRSDRSLNEYISAVLSAATDPDLAGSESAAIRERLALANLLEPQATSGTARRPSKRAVTAAGRRAASGTPLDELVASGR